MRIAARFMISIVPAIVLFLVGVFATFEINLSIYSVKAFDGDAGAKFGLLGESLAVGAVLGIVGFAVGAKLSVRLLPGPSEPRT